MSNIERLLGSVRAILLFAALPARAAEEQASEMLVTATVQGSCAIDSVDAMDFGAVTTTGNTISAELDAQADLRLTCSDGTNWAVFANRGDHAAGNQMRLADAGDTAFVNYALTLDVERSVAVPLSAAQAAGTAASGTGNNLQHVFTLYGRIPAGQPLPPVDAYGDQVIFTVSF